MWDDLLEIAAEVLDIAIDVGGSGTRPILIAISSLAWLTVASFLLWVGIAEKDITLIVLGAALLVALAVWLFVKISRYRHRER